MQNSIPIFTVLPNLGLLILLLLFNTEKIRQKKRTLLTFLSLSFLIQLTATLFGFFQSPSEHVLAAYHTLGISFHTTPLNLLFSLVAGIIQWIVLRFSFNYLQSENNLPYFIKHVSLIGLGLHAVFFSSNLLVTGTFLLLISYSTSQLIGYYSSRKSSAYTKRKYRIVEYISNGLLLTAFLLFTNLAKSAHIPTICSTLALDDSFLKSLAVGLFTLGCFIKSAQFPFHSWLTEVMEAPTPVSALLHAGIIGIGPFLLHSFGPIIYPSTAFMILIIGISLLSILLGALSFAQQHGIKNLLAYSSIAHLGFTILLFGLGLPGASLLHFSAHAFYKAHAFLSSGSELDRKNAKAFYTPNIKRKLIGICVLFLTPLALWIALNTWNIDPLIRSEQSLLLFIGLTIGTLFANAITRSHKIGFSLPIFVLGLATLTSFICFESVFNSIHTSNAYPPVIHTVRNAVLVLFSVFIVYRQIVQLNLIQPLIPQFNIHLQNGLYIPVLVNRIYTKLINNEK